MVAFALAPQAGPPGTVVHVSGAGCSPGLLDSSDTDFVSVAAPSLAQEYQSKELSDAARDWRRELVESVPVNRKQPGLVAGWRRTAELDYQAKHFGGAIDLLTRAIANGARWPNQPVIGCRAAAWCSGATQMKAGEPGPPSKP